MPAEAKMSGNQAKICAGCGADVATTRRFKDPHGTYYCADCYAAATSQTAPTPAQVPVRAPAADEPPERIKSRLFGLIPNVTCPHCWHHFGPEDVMWIAAHNDLVGDPVLGPEKPRRFLPTRFTVNGQAIDARGVVCQQLACPRCHLILPRSTIEAEPLFMSIIGGPKTGKSYLLSAMTWELRKRLPSAFALSFNDADPVANQHLNEYEATLFLPEDASKLVALAKTEESGDLYDQASIGGHTVSLPRPFLFNVRPTSQHLHANHAEKVSRVICMYDNAGESYQPGKDTSASPVTQHLAKSKVLMFLFDPTQDPRFREKCRAFNQDPQLTSGRGTQRQEILLNEAASRVRRYSNLPPGKKHDRPLMILVPKSDVWGSLIDEDLISEPFLPNAVADRLAAVDVVRIERVSKKIRELLQVETPELVAAAEDFCQHVVYIPISALGRSPEETALPGGGSGLFVRPKDIAPHWAAVPVLYMFAKWTTGLIASNAPVAGKRAATNHNAAPR
jgi:hypothetical protein